MKNEAVVANYVPYTKEDILKYVSTVRNLVNLLEHLSRLTPGSKDNDAVAQAKLYLAQAEDLVTQDWFVELVNYGRGLFGNEDPKVIFGALKAVVDEQKDAEGV